ncbi:short chain dehydrogenase/reductase [Patellaria atrata CBS 101060]|uniref:Short chain dehydrogenase/reductase n=1 Tax=Patellaria atrata CBS 101060 TaxID=1346257 RepID=A0A9P4S7Y4_9PEZI|nr:short chain dehydrogenase/reductase [Patellaria atrata CBS 101060]
MSNTAVIKPGNTSLITGGASGIGLAVATLCRKHGMRVAIVDYSNEYLAKAKEILGGSEDVETYQVDVSDLNQLHRLKDKVLERFGSVEFLMLNAGVSAKGGWNDVDYFHKILDTNLYGVINGISTFMPVVTSASGPSAIVITGSKQGITNPPGNPAYNASKAAVKALAEHLSYDLRDTKTSVHLLVPGWTFTGMSGGGPLSNTEKPAGAWWPEQVADYLYQKMDEGKFYAICPDNDVTSDMDKKRMLWSNGDLVDERPALSRWRETWQDDVKAYMKRDLNDLMGSPNLSQMGNEIEE